MVVKAEIGQSGRRKYPRYSSMDTEGDISYGDPYKVFGIDSLFGQYNLDKQIYTIKPESVIGKLKVGDDKMQLTTGVKRRALRLIQHDENNLVTGKVVYVIYPDIYPYSLLNIEGTPFEEIYPDWPVDIEFLSGSLATEIMRPEAKTLAVSVDALWRERGGDPKHKFSKKGGWRFLKH